MRSNVLETLIGAIVLVAAGYFLVFAYNVTGMGGAANGYVLTAKFDRIDGITVGSDVRLAGVKVGTVSGQRLDPKTFQAVLEMDIDQAIALPDDSAVKIAASGLLGDNYLSLEPGGSANMLASGGEIQFTQGSVNIMDLISQAIFSSAGGGGAAEPSSEPKPAP